MSWHHRRPCGVLVLPAFYGRGEQVLSSLIPVSSGASFQAYMPLSGGQFTGPVEAAVVSLTDAASISVNAALGNLFRVTLGGNRTLANPSGGTDGQMIRVEVTQDGSGSRTLAYGTAYDFGSAGTPTLAPPRRRWMFSGSVTTRAPGNGDASHSRAGTDGRPRAAGIPLLQAVTYWECPNCPATDRTAPLPPGSSRFHNCPGLHGLTAPLVRAGTRCKVRLRCARTT